MIWGIRHTITKNTTVRALILVFHARHHVTPSPPSTEPREVTPRFNIRNGLTALHKRKKQSRKWSLNKKIAASLKLIRQTVKAEFGKGRLLHMKTAPLCHHWRLKGCWCPGNNVLMLHCVPQWEVLKAGWELGSSFELWVLLTRGNALLIKKCYMASSYYYFHY